MEVLRGNAENPLGSRHSPLCLHYVVVTQVPLATRINKASWMLLLAYRFSAQESKMATCNLIFLFFKNVFDVGHFKAFH